METLAPRGLHEAFEVDGAQGRPDESRALDHVEPFDARARIEIEHDPVWLLQMASDRVPRVDIVVFELVQPLLAGGRPVDERGELRRDERRERSAPRARHFGRRRALVLRHEFMVSRRLAGVHQRSIHRLVDLAGAATAKLRVRAAT